MHSNQRKPVLAAQVVPGKVDSKSWLRELWWNFLRWQSYLPDPVWMSIETQVFLTLRKHKGKTSNLTEEHNILFNYYKTTYINNLNLTEIKTRKMNMDVTLYSTRPKRHTANSALLFDFLTLTKQYMNHAKQKLTFSPLLSTLFVSFSV